MHPFRSIVVKLYFWIGNFQGNFLLSAIGRRLLAKWCRSNVPFKCMTRNVHLFLSLGFLLSFQKRFGWISILKWRTFRFSLFRVSHQFSGHKVELKSQSRNLRYLTSGFIFVKAHELLKNSDTGERKKAVEGKWERRLKKRWEVDFTKVTNPPRKVSFKICLWDFWDSESVSQFILFYNETKKNPLENPKYDKYFSQIFVFTTP